MNDILEKELVESLKWCLDKLDSFVHFSPDGSAYIEGNELVGFTVKYNKIKKLLHQIEK